MKNIEISSKIVQRILAVVLMMAIIPMSTIAEGKKDKSKHDGRTWNIEGIAVTGPNDVCGEPQWVMPAPFPPDTHFTILGEFDPSPDAIDAVPFSPESCDDDALLATHTSPALNQAGGFPDADSRLKNVPLRQVPITATVDGMRMTLPDMDAVPPNPFPPTKSKPNDPITLGDWLCANGEMKVECFDDGSAKIKAKFRQLIPNGVYSFVATWLTTPPGATEPTFVPLPFGGIPNEVVANKRGNATIARDLNYCPMDPTADGSIIMFADLGYHTDGSTAGVFPQTVSEVETFLGSDGEVFESTKPPGIFAMPHVGFPMQVDSPKAN